MVLRYCFAHLPPQNLDSWEVYNQFIFGKQSMSPKDSAIIYHDTSVVKINPEVEKSAWINPAKYSEMYAESISNTEKFWAEQAKQLDWIKPFTKVKNTSFKDDISIKWFEDGELNV